MSPPWRDVAIYGTAAAVGVLSAGSIPAGEAANCLKVLLDGRAPNFRSLVARAERALDELIAREHGGEAGFAPVRATVEQLLAQHGWSPAFAVEADLDPDTIADRILRSGEALFVGMPAGAQGLARRLIACVYRAILADSVQLNQVLPEALSALLKLRGEIAALPAATAEALLDLQTRLLLTPGTRVLTEPQPKDSWLLRPDYAVVPFDPARQPDLEELLAWCEDGRPRAVRLLHGPGGYGKSRLLIEATRLLRGRGWHAGFLARSDAIPPAGTYERLCGGERPVCIAIDYAETRREEVARVLRRVRSGGAPALRVVLLARAAGDWWPELKRADADVQELLDAYSGEHALPPVADDPATRRRSFEAAAAAFARRLGQNDGTAAPPDLSAPDYGRFLFVHLAALAAVRGEVPERADRLLAWVLNRERRAWRLGLEDDELRPVKQYEALVAQAVALATLAGSIRSEAELDALTATAPLTQGVEPLKLRAVGRLVARLYPDVSGLGTLRPDLLGEELMAEELTSDLRLHEAAFGAEVPDERLEAALTVLARLARREPESTCHLEAALAGRLDHPIPNTVKVAVETGGPIGRVLAQAVVRKPPADPRPLERLLPNQTVALREFRVAVASQIRDRLRVEAEGGGDVELPALARISSNLGIYLSELNRRPEALAAAEEATATYRRLAQANPDAFLPDLARSLSNLGIQLSQLNRRPEALAAAEEATATYRRLAQANPDAFLPDLATSLSSLADRLEENGRMEEALARDREAIGALAPFAQRLPAAFGPDLAIYIRDYERRCTAAGVEPDAALLGLVPALPD